MKFLIVLCFIIININAEFIETKYKNKKFETRKEIINKKMEDIKLLKKEEQLKEVNRFFNLSIRYTSDQKLYNKNNYIAPIEETILTMQGDCDDYVLAKLQAIEYLGFKNNKLLFTTEKGVRHVQIISTVNNKSYILDSLNKKFRELNKNRLKEKDVNIYDGSIYMRVATIKNKKTIEKV